MLLKDVEKLLFKEAIGGPSSSIDALIRMKSASDKALDYLRHQNPVLAQVYLEHCFSLMIHAFHYLNVNLEQVVQREIQRSRGEVNATQQRVILVFGDHAELRVNGELRGTFPLYDEADYQEVRQIAQLFECRIEHSDFVQLNLLNTLSSDTPDKLPKEYGLKKPEEGTPL